MGGQRDTKITWSTHAGTERHRVGEGLLWEARAGAPNSAWVWARHVCWGRGMLGVMESYSEKGDMSAELGDKDGVA